VYVTNTDRELLEWIKRTTGIGVIGTQKRYSSRHKPTFVWLLRVPEMVPFLMTIKDDLVSKGDQANLLLEFLTTPWTRPLSEEHQVLRVVMFEEMRELNRRGA
jgi:hypothetical protein